MKFLIKLFAIILLCFSNLSNCTTIGATTIDELRSELIEIETLAWKIVDGTLPRDRKLEQIIARHESFASINLGVDYQENEFLTLNHMYDWKYLEKDLITITKLFSEFRRLLKRQLNEGLEELANIDFAETVLEDKTWDIPGIFDNIHSMMVQQGLYYKSLLESTAYSCSIKQSPQQVLVQLYNAISVTELKGYAMLQFAWMLLKSYDKGNYTGEAELNRKRFNERTLKTQEYLRKILERADRALIRCDPSLHVEGETYVALTRLLQGYIENEVDMNNDGTCRETCDFYQYTENHGCFKDLYCSRQPKCHGKLIKCQFVDSDMWICPSPKNNSTRRYEYIEYENGRVLGKKASCREGTTKVDSWWRWLFWHCSYCFCYCDEQGPKSDRYFNLRDVLSNTTANKVVTGVRFVKKNRVIHLQIQEGELMMRGNINPATVEWKPVDSYDIRDRGVRNSVDYHTMAYEKRAIDLDDLIATNENVVTGVRFRIVGTHLNLEIRATEMNFAEGKLVDPETTSYWISNDNTDTSNDKRTKINIYKPDIPTSIMAASQLISKTNQFIEFSHTDMEADGAQTTIPFIDAQDATSDPPVPLSGLGIYYKGRDRSGGFIGPKIITYNVSPHIKIPDEVENKIHHT